MSGSRLICPQLFVIFDDAVVNHRDTMSADVGVGIGLGRQSVRGPAGMGDTQHAVD